MKHTRILLGLCGVMLIVLIGNWGLFAQEQDDQYSMTISPRNAKIVVGEEIQFRAQVKDSTGKVVATQFTWWLEVDSIGTISESGLFYAEKAGESKVFAKSVDLGIEQEAEIEITAASSDTTGDDHSNRGERSRDSDQLGNLILRIRPGHVELELNESFQFQVLVTSLDGSSIDTIVVWDVFPDSIGTIDQEGYFTATAKGEGFVTASVGDLSVRAHVKVGDDIEGERGQEESDLFSIIVSPEEAEVCIGDSVQFTAEVFDTTGAQIDTTVSWRLEGWHIGDIDSTGLFIASAQGEGYSVAYLGSDQGRAKIEVESSEPGMAERGKNHRNRHRHNYDDESGYTLLLEPQDTVIYVGDIVQFTASLIDSNGNELDTTYTWQLQGNESIGELSKDGQFTALSAGMMFVQVRVGGLVERTSIHVLEDTEPPTDANTITIRRRLPNGYLIREFKVIQEGGVLRLSGFPFPFNVLNGGLLTIPEGSLDEDIVITIGLSELTDVQTNEVNYHQKVFGSVEFEIMVDGAVVHPYYFNQPLQLSLPYKRGLLHELGIDPESMDMAYYLGNEVFSDAGISNVVVDTLKNRIFADVEHFSVLAIVESGTVTSIHSSNSTVPKELILHQNYPNPFNPETTIQFTLSHETHVELKIYNILGSEIKTLFAGIKPAGVVRLNWNGTDALNHPVASGIYFYRIETKNAVKVKRMMLMR